MTRHLVHVRTFCGLTGDCSACWWYTRGRRQCVKLPLIDARRMSERYFRRVLTDKRRFTHVRLRSSTLSSVRPRCA